MIKKSISLFSLAVTLFITSAEAAQSLTSANSPETTVLKFYRDFAWEAVMDVPGWDGLIDQPKNVLGQYFDERLTFLILRDRECAKKNGQCRLDFLPIWASQDPGAGDLKVEKSGEADCVLVTFRYPSTNEKIQLKYRISETPKGWRISDIKGPDWSLLSILESPR